MIGSWLVALVGMGCAALAGMVAIVILELKAQRDRAKRTEEPTDFGQTG